jgi:ankyrin repeat protein
MILKNKLLILSLLLLPFFGFSQSVHELARTGTVDSMKALLDKDPSSVNRLSERGITPFVLACYRGNNDVAKLLAKRGADIRYCAAEGSALYGIIFKKKILLSSPLINKNLQIYF